MQILNRSRRRQRASLLLPLLISLLVAGTAVADIVVYTLPGSGRKIVLQGQTKVVGRSLAYIHPKFGRLLMSLNTERKPVPTPTKQFNRRMVKAKGDAEQIMEVADWCIRFGLPEKTYLAAAEALKLDPKHKKANRIKLLKRMIDKPIKDSSKEESYLRSQARKDMKIALSDHYILMHDVSDKRAKERLDLLERVYETFLLKFYSQGIRLEIPKQRLMVMLYGKQSDYNTFSSSIIDPDDLRSVAGFWHTITNIAVFYDQGAGERFESIRKAEREFAERAEEAKKFHGRAKRSAMGRVTTNAGDIVRVANLLGMLMKIAREDADVEVVSHEATHQMAGNTGLLPRHVQIPSWMHEGLATYFESPADASWSGPGSVNEDRLSLYRKLSGDKEHSNVSYIVGDQIFRYAGSLGATLHGYGQSWALTHYLLEEHPEKYVEFCKKLGRMPADIILSPEVLTELFQSCFPEDEIDAVNAQWKGYMRSLKTDNEKILEGEE